jgi:hypothetical protein
MPIENGRNPLSPKSPQAAKVFIWGGIRQLSGPPTPQFRGVRDTIIPSLRPQTPRSGHDKLPSSHSCEVEAFDHDSRTFAAVSAQFGLAGSFFSGHQRDVIVAVEGGQDAIAALFPYRFHPHHQRRLAA